MNGIRGNMNAHKHYKRLKRSKNKPFKFPLEMYYVAKFFENNKGSALKLHEIENIILRNKINKIKIDRPIYVTGLARSGTTITTEMLMKHCTVATHKYLHMVMPYVPFIIQKLANIVPLFEDKLERLHQDRIVVDKESPEAVEEWFWKDWFSSIFREEKSNIFDNKDTNKSFERFYRYHIRKLIISQNASRYVVKNNYNIARTEYLQKLFPDAKFIFLVRNPINHIASLIKQDYLFLEMQRKNPRLLDWTKIIGHREFGSAKVSINLNDYETTKKIREMWDKKETYITGWAIYWNSIYSYLHKKLDSNKQLAQSSIIIKYEDMCGRSKEIIEKIISHTELSTDKYQHIMKEYANKLNRPKYYKHTFTEKEINTINNLTKETAKKFGYILF